jgi:hypothetical protein
MNTRNALLHALATLLAGFLITAPAAAQDTQVLQGQVEDAAMSKATLGVPFMFSVEGLTTGNIEKVTRSVMSLTETVYVCSGCKHMGATAGRCIPCDVELKAKQEPIVYEALPSFKEASIRLTPFAARTLSYSALEVALAKNSIEIDAAKFPLAGASRLVLRGGALADVRAIEKALKASGFFESVKTSYDAESTEIHVVVQALATPPMYDKVAATIEALDTKATLVDVIWGPQPIPAKS